MSPWCQTVCQISHHLPDDYSTSIPTPLLTSTTSKVLVSYQAYCAGHDPQTQLLRTLQSPKKPHMGLIIIVPQQPSALHLTAFGSSLQVFFDITVDGESIGRFVVGLYGDEAPIGSARFADLGEPLNRRSLKLGQYDRKASISSSSFL